jgi:large subunit ribosomal protein L7/L12|uniref:Large ribosomal subunit protein bL12 n=1 Tax=candidate division WOR-3 bacterium TaxID=2052148 RepID=A0A7V5XZY7_UNCW3
MSAKIDELINIIENLTVMELAELVQRLKDKFGITQTAFVAPAGSVQTPTAPEVKEEKTEFTVTLVAVGDKKIQVLKELRALTNLGLKEAKDLIDNVPSVIKEKATKEEAEKIKAKLEEVGAKVEIK